MNGIIIRGLTLTGAIILTSYLLDGIHVSGFFWALLAAAMLGFLNAFFRPIALLLTLPINVLTPGIITGFEVYGFWSAIFGSLLISVISWLLNSFINDRGTVTFFDSEYRDRHNPRAGNDTIDLEHKGEDKWE